MQWWERMVSWNKRSKLTDGNGEICSRAIREQICDWKGRREDNDY